MVHRRPRVAEERVVRLVLEHLEPSAGRCARWPPRQNPRIPTFFGFTDALARRNSAAPRMSFLATPTGEPGVAWRR
jgi:hypothetical protein